ncbi:MAG TPA: phosphotransferase, partial [Steroidobacteraceae bacterium]|nr:phosphotransferase [Steroidobacteraceae bacterium]
MTENDARAAQLQEWLTAGLGRPIERLTLASADASFRRYFRVHADGVSWIAMDAPPGREDVRPYLRVARLLEETGVHVPHVHAFDIEQGFVLLEDLGDTPYLTQLARGEDVERLYADALAALAAIQVRGREAARELPPYDDQTLQRELDLMPEWFCARHLRLALDDGELGLIVRTFDFLIEEALAQPRVFVHRDYHSRNLM